MSGSVAVAPVQEATSPVVITGQMEAPVVQDVVETLPAVYLEAAPQTAQVVMPSTTMSYPVTYASAPTYAAPMTYTMQAPMTYTYPVAQQQEQVVFADATAPAVTYAAPAVEETREVNAPVHSAPVYYTMSRPTEAPVYYTMAAPNSYTVQPQMMVQESVEAAPVEVAGDAPATVEPVPVQEAAPVSYTYAAPYSYSMGPASYTYAPQTTFANPMVLQSAPSMIQPAYTTMYPIAADAPVSEEVVVSEAKSSKKSAKTRGVATKSKKSCCF